MVSFDPIGVGGYGIKNDFPLSTDWMSYVPAIKSFDITDPDDHNSNDNRTETVNENPDDDNSSDDDDSDDLPSLQDPRDDSTLSLEVDEVVELIDHLELEQIFARHTAIEVVARVSYNARIVDTEIFARHEAIEISVSENRLIVDSGFVDSSPGNNDDSTYVDNIRSPTGVVEALVYFSTEG